MAEGVPFTIVGGILKTLGPIITNEIILLWGFQNELQNLERTVTTIKAVLLDAEERRATSNAVSLWLGELSDILYEADDFVDAISTEALRQGQVTGDKKAKKVCKFSPILKNPFHVLKMGYRLREIRGKIDAIAADISKFQFLVRTEEGRRCWRRGDTYSYLGAERVIGRDDDKKTLVNRLKASEAEGNVSIVPIVGIGGLGKTTLAKLIFNDPEIQKTFKLKMWICVSDSFDVKVIVKKILKSVSEEFDENDPMDELVKHLQKGIERKKYLLVLDDVWCEVSSQWSELNNLLMCGGRGSKILVTTRKLSVSNILRTKPHQLDGLGEKDSWELFKQVAFVNRSESRNFKEVGREILKRCKGVPLAVKTVGRLLYSKSLEEWRKFIDDELSKIPQEEAEIIPTLKLSYDELHPNLKHCFAFCSLFPKDHMFEITTLINHWIAQGFVNSEENQCLEDIGYEYFMNLLWRSFFQEVRMDEFDNIVGCKMHDLMHDLAMSIARSLIITLPSKNSMNYPKVRHVVVTQNLVVDSAMLSSLHGASMIRTFLCRSFSKCDDNSRHVIIKCFKSLRTLDLSGNILHDVPRFIGKLKHLRFLNLSYNKEIKMLPSSLTKLVNLQSLCLTECKKLQYLPRKFGQLVKLRHLNTSYCGKLRCLPHKMGPLKELQTLNLKDCFSLEQLPKDVGKLVNLRFLDIRNCTKLKYLPCGFKQLTNLKRLIDLKVNLSSSKDVGGLDELSNLNDLRGNLTIRCLSCGEGVATQYKAANLKGKEHLNTLHLEWSNEVVVNGLDDDVSLEGLQPHQNLKHLKLLGCWCPKHPSWLSLLTSLVSLSLKECSKWQYLASLNHLPSLQHLELCNMKSMEYISNLGEQSDFSPSSLAQMMFFPSLKEMMLTNCPNLKSWWGGSSVDNDNLAFSFPLLSRLEIQGCPMLTSMAMFPHLEEPLVLVNTSWKPLQQTLMMSTAVAMASSRLADSLGTPLSKLKKIECDSIIDLEALPEEGLQNLTSLEILKFYNCDKLKSLSPGVQNLTTVKKLDITWCPIFGEDEDGIRWQGLKSLRDLEFYDLPKLSYLPLGLQYVITLKKLQILRCQNLESIAEWIHQCISLVELKIQDCPRLASLPLETCERWSLERLEIRWCPLLAQKCGEYFPKISHIPKLYVDLQSATATTIAINNGT